MSQLIAVIYVVLGLPKRNKDLLAFAKAVLAALTNNPHFPTPNPTLAVFSADVAAFDQAETATIGGGAGVATLRNAKKTKVVQDLRHLRDYVQGVVENLTTDAATVVESAGFRLRKMPSFHKQELAVDDGPASGIVLLAAKAVADIANYYWQYSPDAGKTWTSCPDTLQARTTVAGLATGTTYSFRFRALTRAGLSDFSQIVTHVVK